MTTNGITYLATCECQIMSQVPNIASDETLIIDSALVPLLSIITASIHTENRIVQTPMFFEGEHFCLLMALIGALAGSPYGVNVIGEDDRIAR